MHTNDLPPSLSSLPPGRRAVVSEFGESPLEALERKEKDHKKEKYAVQKRQDRPQSEKVKTLPRIETSLLAVIRFVDLGRPRGYSPWNTMGQ